MYIQLGFWSSRLSIESRPAKESRINAWSIKKRNDYQELYTLRNESSKPPLENTLKVLFILRYGSS